MACAAVVAAMFDARGRVWDQTTAAWVQAIGSIGAILGAVWAAREDTRRAREADTVRTIARVEMVCSLAWQADDFAREVLACRKRGDYPPAPVNLDLTLELIDRFPVESYPSGEMALRMASVRRLAEGFRRQHETWMPHVGGDTEKEYLRAMIAFQREIDREYEGLADCGQLLLDSLPGRRVVLPRGWQRA